MALPVKNFFGEIGGKTIYDFSRKLDYKLDLEQRKELCNRLLYGENGELDQFFTELFDQKFDVKEEREKTPEFEVVDEVDESNLSYTGQNISHVKLILSGEDNLYGETNIAKEIDKISNYLLFATDKEERVEYKIYKDEALFQKMLKETSVEGVTEGGEENVIHFLMEKGKNNKKAIQQIVTKEDIEKIPELKEYQKSLDSISFKLKRLAYLEKLFSKTSRFENIDLLTPEDISLLNQYKLKVEDLTQDKFKEFEKEKSLLQKHSALIKQDMIYIKDCKMGTIYFKQPLADSTEIDYDMIDWSNEEQIMALLRQNKGMNLENDMGCIMFDLHRLIKRTDTLSDRDRKILSFYRKGLTLEHIGKKMGVSKQSINSALNKIVKKIKEAYSEQYEDWYYRECEKGVYKKCSKCGEVKIENNKNFLVKSNGNYYAHCRECEKARKKEKKICA